MFIFTWFDGVLLIRKLNSKVTLTYAARMTQMQILETINCIVCRCSFIPLSENTENSGMIWSFVQMLNLKGEPTFRLWHLLDLSCCEIMWMKWNFNDLPWGEFGTRTVFMNPTLFSGKSDLQNKYNTWGEKNVHLCLSLLSLSFIFSFPDIETHT